MGGICCAVVAPTTERALEAAARAREAGADLVEFRLDAMERFDLAALLAGSPLPAVVTFRRADQGGLRETPETERIGHLEEAGRLGAKYIDIELDSRLPERGRAKLIVSHHDFSGVPADLAAIWRRIEASDADVVKLAVTPHDPVECIPLYEALRASGKPAVAVAMGEAGFASRLLALKLGAVFSFASIETGAESAPGQATVHAMQDVYRARAIGPNTRVYGVIGDPVAHSASPAMQNAALAGAGLDAVYVPWRVTGDPAAFVRAQRAAGLLDGLSVTIPHKEGVRAALDRTDALAGRVGAVNTVAVEDGSLAGFNTDVPAALGAIRSALAGGEDLAGKRALVLGAGGVARAIALALVDAGARVSIANRTHARARRLAAELESEAVPLAGAGSLEYDVLANATSVGMHPDADRTPLDAAELRPGAVVFDAVYNPIETRLLREARAAGCRVADGLVMLVEQGALQFERWTGREANRGAMRAAARGAVELAGA